MSADWLKIMLPWLYRDTELAQGVDVIMAQEKRSNNLKIKGNKLLSFS